jgi:hypothetical protein
VIAAHLGWQFWSETSSERTPRGSNLPLCIVIVAAKAVQASTTVDLLGVVWVFIPSLLLGVEVLWELLLVFPEHSSQIAANQHEAWWWSHKDSTTRSQLSFSTFGKFVALLL